MSDKIYIMNHASYIKKLNPGWRRICRTTFLKKSPDK